MANNSTNQTKLNLTVFFLLLVYPAFIIASIIHYGLHFGITKFEIALAVIAYYGANISVGLGLHRLWSHSAYKVNRVIEFMLAVVSAGTLQGPILAWASDHFKHHTYTDQELDPHSPNKYKNKWMGFFWSHMGWMLYHGSFKNIDRVTMKKLGRNKIVIWQFKNYWRLAFIMNVILPIAIGYILGGNLLSAWAAFIFIGLGRAIQQQVTFCVNSICHFFGTRKYYKGTARDVWWLSLFLLGENWHNYHHAFANDYRNGVKWYHFDAHKWLIAILEKLGLAWDLVRTPPERIEAKLQDTACTISEQVRMRLEMALKYANALSDAAMKKIEQAEFSARELKGNMRAKLRKLDNSSRILAATVNEWLESNDLLSEKIWRRIYNRTKKLESLATNVNINLPNYFAITAN
jgi:stearoyl-CoA desaturase (delta-9 desaturase)